MQKINIDWIIVKLKNTQEWEDYKTYLDKNKSKFNNNVDYFIWKEIVLDLINWKEINLYKVDKKWILNKYNNWWKLNKIDVVKNVKNKFIEFFIEKIKFCPFCGKSPLILFNSDLQKEKWFLEKVRNNIWKLIWWKEFENGRLFDLDHFFPKEKYSYLAINFYNLIPICKWCNYIKNNNDVLNDKKGIFHPYFWYLDNLWDFNLKDNFIFEWNHSDFFKLKEIYLNSQDTKNDIWFIKDKIEHIKTNKINDKNLWLNNFNLEERKEFFFKNYYPKTEQEILKYSNWKLKKDLIEGIKLD